MSGNSVASWANRVLRSMSIPAARTPGSLRWCPLGRGPGSFTCMPALQRRIAKHRVWDHLPEFVEGVLAFATSQELHYDLLHSHYWLSGWVALQLRQLWALPMVHMSHTLGYPKNAAAQQVWEQEPPRRLRVEYDILKHSDALVAESPASKQHMVQEYGVDPARVQIIPCGVDTLLFRPQNRQQARRALALPEAAPLVLFVGACSP